MSFKNDVKNAKVILAKLGKKKPNKTESLAMIRQWTKWDEGKIQKVLKAIDEEKE